MITVPTRSAPPWLAMAAFLVGMAGVAGSITVVLLGMRSVLDVGGQCASGGPYVIAVPCPDGTWTLPLAVFAGLGFVFLAVTGGTKIGGLYAMLPGLAWVGLFCSLGFNFLQWGIAPPADPSVDSSGGGIIFVLLGLMFEAMGIVPLITTLLDMRSGASKDPVSFGGRSFTAADLQRNSDPLRTDDSTATRAAFQSPLQAPFQAMAGGKAVDMNELMSEVAKTVAEARAKGIIGPERFEALVAYTADPNAVRRRARPVPAPDRHGQRGPGALRGRHPDRHRPPGRHWALDHRTWK